MLPLLKFRPVLLTKPWGGNALWTRLHKGAPRDEGMGESWELSDRQDGLSVVEGGPLAGQSFAEVLKTQAADVFGDLHEAAADPVFPLLYKFIAAREKLSVQVHPGAGSPLGEAKTECWYVVDAVPGASLIVGVDPGGRSRAETLTALKSPDCEAVLQRLPAAPGDMFFIPAGTVHAITEGLLLYELQQNSDTTFRLYDWGRVDAAGTPRALHLDEAAQVADLVCREGYRIAPLARALPTHTESFLVACKYFALVKWSGFKNAEGVFAAARLETSGRFRVVTAVAGHAVLRDREGRETPLKLGDTVLVPACHAFVEVEASADAELLVSFVPDLERDVRAPLRGAGYSAEETAGLFGPQGIEV